MSNVIHLDKFRKRRRRRFKIKQVLPFIYKTSVLILLLSMLFFYVWLFFSLTNKLFLGTVL